MKHFIILSLLVAFSAHANEKKAPEAKAVSLKIENKDVAPCDSAEDVLKKLEKKKEESKKTNQAFSLQGKNDSGCSLK